MVMIGEFHGITTQPTVYLKIVACHVILTSIRSPEPLEIQSSLRLKKNIVILRSIFVEGVENHS